MQDLCLLADCLFFKEKPYAEDESQHRQQNHGNISKSHLGYLPDGKFSFYRVSLRDSIAERLVNRVFQIPVAIEVPVAIDDYRITVSFYVDTVALVDAIALCAADKDAVMMD